MTSPNTLRAAVIQVNAGPEIEANLVQAGALVRGAVADGAQLVCLPENVSLMAQGREKILARVKPEESHPGVPFFRDLARETGAWIMTGTLGCLLEDGRVANRAFVVAPNGDIVARYDKIHMFDVDLAGGESYRESATYRPGERAVVAPTPWGGLGLSICYDVRFAYLFRALAKAGASLITVPAAFTVPTGRAHWHVLLRARAIETGCFVLAPAQTGLHDGGRGTYGHSLIISPWGEVLADAGEGVGHVIADLDLDKVAEARRMVPSLGHDRSFQGP
ncbi:MULTISPECIES: carbon-nitrogen hydrolase family protein [unclassified Azospirillum]|uniref:carbon-nitrogen hydrolase family protein n=1 Tax=unclassified Azospirillum TaxID=2630922 RepID=UPI000B6758EB|nr:MULTISPECIES: carbon-nitrogen hydrolase family protein [unclassified Azospirillum]SNS63340.1 Predicted amidohydrolase [Azospirillum sp. RU38E]SNS82468.1 Predicted amidohydrolase [Azospirillum sp. RU37A]